MKMTGVEIGLPNGKSYILRDDGKRVVAYEKGKSPDTEKVVFDYEQTGMIDAYLIVELLLRRVAPDAV